MEFVLQTVVPAIIGALSAGLPLYAKIRSINATAKKADLKVDEQAEKVEQVKVINKEAEWKRILDERAKSEAKLEAKSEQQDKRIEDLLSRFIESEKAKAAKDERIKVLEEKIDKLNILLTQRCPECPSRQNLTLLPSDKPHASSPGQIATSAGSSSPPTT